MPPVQPDPNDRRDSIDAPAGTDPAPIDPGGPDSNPPPPPGPFRWKTNLVLFVATVLSVFFVGALYQASYDGGLSEASGWRDLLHVLPSGWRFAVPLLAILLTHEFGHYFAARYHRVPASLPYFIPFPFSPFGTMGAVISMRGRIKSRNALLDIGASGPLAGMAVAIPVLVIGLMGSRINVPTGSFYQEGQSLLYLGLKRVVLGPLQNGEDVSLNPVAFAGWTGLFITALNLIPIFQLDGGHIAYALFGSRQNRYARLLHWGLLVMFLYNAARFVGPVVMHQRWDEIDQAISNSSFWFVWFLFIHILMRVGGRDHPPTNPGELSPVRRAVAGFSLLLFVLLFMPTPFAQYGSG
jgi:membrane-associated protease RseP (regulator of RpoE activity)